MSKLFQVNLVSGKKATLNANNVVGVIDNGDTVEILTGGDGCLVVTNTYRSVRGYLNKALGGKTTSDAEQADSAE